MMIIDQKLDMRMNAMREEERRLKERHGEFLERLAAALSDPEHPREKASIVLQEVEISWFWCGRRDGLEAIAEAARKLST